MEEIENRRYHITLKVAVFDLGGTLIEYVGMPYSWVDFYYKGFETIIQKYKARIPQEVILKSVQMLKEFNPRVNYREIEYSAEYIFTKTLEDWNMEISVQSCIETFWSGLQLQAEIYSEVKEVLQTLREKSYAIAALTDLPCAMPDEIFKQDISELLDYFDYYVSSAVAGYRKPNCRGLQMISEKFDTSITELIFIGDEEKDRKTALNADCKFIRIQRTNKNGDSIGNLYELLEIL
ncbi:MAG: HAD family hydrolase [Butyrivibrio sp.]|nr:HAD family hydrolase [Butyrivibrio sp.]